MTARSSGGTGILDIGLVASLVALLALLGNKHSFAPAIYMLLVVSLLLAATALAWWREARREWQLDELELASASFGARWSMAVVSVVPLLIIFIPVLQDLIVSFAQAYEANKGRPLPASVGVFVLGFVLAMFVQLSAKSVLGAVWTWTKR